MIWKSFPEANLAPNVFISTVSPSELERTQGPIWGQVALILTGLSEQQIKQLGGYRVVDPVATRVLLEAPPLVA